MAEALTFKTSEKPGYFNKEMVLGGLIGLLLPMGIAWGAVGAFIGGYWGKRRILKENATGKEVKTPSFWNKDTLIGGLLGHYTGIMAGAAAFIGITGASLFSFGDFTMVKAAVQNAPALMTAGFAAAAAAWAAITAAGVALGGKRGYRRMEDEHRLALQQRELRLEGRAPIRDVERKVEAADEVIFDKSFVAMLQEEREQTLKEAMDPQKRIFEV